MARFLCLLIVIGLVSLNSVTAAAATPGLLELTVDDTPHTGRLIAKTSQYCWLMDQEGRILRVELDRVSSFRKKSAEFRPFSSNVVGDLMRKEFGREFEIARTQHYVVCAPRGKAKQYAAVFEETWKHFHLYFAVRRFDVPEPEFPMTAVIFPDRDEFRDYCRKQGVKHLNYLGIYLGQSNRVALFEPPKIVSLQRKIRPGSRQSIFISRRIDSCDRLASLFPHENDSVTISEFNGTVNSGPEATIIHEATHQLAYNTGLHSRMGENPRWIVEGLATVFEAPGIRNASKNRTVASRINRGRFVHFGNFAAKRYKRKSLEAYLASDKMFETNMSDAYAQAWAFSFFLIETRPRKYGKLLKTIAARKPLLKYTAEQRVADFREIVADNLPLLEAEFLRYMARIHERGKKP